MNQVIPYLPDTLVRELADSKKTLNISLTNDFAFKKVFRNKKALKGLLSSFLNIPVKDITSLEFPDTFLYGQYAEDHEGILDVRVLLNNSKNINIEIQMYFCPYWDERSLFYLSKMYTEDFRKGEDYSALNECVHIGILGFGTGKTEHLYSIVKLVDVITNSVYCSKLSLYVLYLNQLENVTEEEKKTDVYKWARLISASDWEVLKEMAGTDEYMSAAVEEMEKINLDKNLRYQYLMREKAAADEVNIRNYYTKQGIAEGIEMGIQALIQDNLEEGIPRERTIAKLIKRFGLDWERAEQYYAEYSGIEHVNRE